MTSQMLTPTSEIEFHRRSGLAPVSSRREDSEIDIDDVDIIDVDADADADADADGGRLIAQVSMFSKIWH